MCNLSIHNISTVTNKQPHVWWGPPGSERWSDLSPVTQPAIRQSQIRIEVTLVSKPMHVLKYFSACWLILAEPSGRRCCWGLLRVYREKKKKWEELHCGLCLGYLISSPQQSKQVCVNLLYSQMSQTLGSGFEPLPPWQQNAACQLAFHFYH